MIEMVFAIVIIGITVAGVSQIMTRSGTTMEGALSQEAVFLASMESAKIFSHRWDQNSMDPSAGELAYSKILDTYADANYTRTCVNASGTKEEYDGNCTTGYIMTVLRYGGIAQDKHRRFHSQPTGSGQPYPDGVPDGATDINITDEHGYKRTYQVDIDSGYVTSAFGTTYGTDTNSPSDIKVTVVSVNDKGNNNANLVRMRVYSYNIGEIDYAKRIFQ